LLALLFAVALLPRVAGVLWGGIHPDENVNASAKLLSGQWRPDEHYYPPLSNILNAGAFAVMFAVGRLIGVWHSAADFRAQYFADPTPFQMAGRLVCATLGAMAAPITAMLAARFDARRWGCVLAALLVAAIPVNVILSHLSKSADVGMATSFLLVSLCFVDFTRQPNSWRRAAMLGAAMAVAVSFKHSAVFFVGPAFVAALALGRYERREPWGAVLRGGAIVAVTSAVLWVILNIPLLADLRDFIAYQKVQSQMSSRPGGVSDVLRVVGTFLAGAFTGTGLALGIVALGVPVLMRRDRRFLALWACGIVGLLVVMKLTGLRPTPGLYLPYVTLMIGLVGVGYAAWAERMGERHGRVMTLLPLAVGVVLLAWPCVTVVRQALVEPAIVDVARTIRQRVPADAKILATRENQAGLPISVAAQVDERARHERLAAKYKVKLPPLAKERLIDPPGGYHVRRMPAAIGGLEVYDEKDVKTVTPFGWPIQKEEYDLDYWTRQGFTVFVVTDEEQRLTSKVPSYVKLYEQIRASCDLVKEVKARKPLFWEGDTKIYRLRGAAQIPPQTQPVATPG
jgi:hypothetical protein